MNVDYDDLLISRAIENLKLISFSFKGRKIRKAEPHVYLQHKITKVRYLLSYQTEGYSLSGNMGWKIFTSADIYDVTLLDDEFHKKNPKIPKWAEEVSFTKKIKPDKQK